MPNRQPANPYSLVDLTGKKEIMAKDTLPPKEHFEAFEEIRQRGNYNMFDRRAINESGLCKDDYMAVMKNYSELKEKYTKELSS